MEATRLPSVQAVTIRARCYGRDPLGALARLARRTPLANVLPAGWGRYRESALAHALLDGLTGIEIGGSAANPFGLHTQNVDFKDHRETLTNYAIEQRRVCGDVMSVDVTAPGDDLPLDDQGVDFVLASHVIEHFYDPVAAILEWIRVARRFVYLIVPHRDRTLDRYRPVTDANELLERFHAERPIDADTDRHWSVWRTNDFVALVETLGLPVFTVQEFDDKIGNGFTVVIGDLAGLDRNKLVVPQPNVAPAEPLI